MIVELGDNGLRSRYHWTTHDIDEQSIDNYLATVGVLSRSDTPSSRRAIAAYLAVRSKCDFLADDNHDWIAKDYGPCAPEHLSIKEMTQSSRYSIVINHKPGQEWYGYRYWFHFAYRVPGQPY